MKTFYRGCPYMSPNPNPLGNDKEYIFKRCLESFLKAGKSDITFIGNDLPEDWLPKGSKLVKFDNKKGSMRSLAVTVDEICKLPDEEKVLVAEDDYIWLPDTLEPLEKALDTFPIVSPYDHPGHYMEERFKYTPRRIVLVDNHTWRQAPSNTHTFACRAEIIKSNVTLLLTNGDHEFFTKLGMDLFVPIPSFATHLVTGLLAPNICWDI